MYLSEPDPAFPGSVTGSATPSADGEGHLAQIPGRMSRQAALRLAAGTRARSVSLAGTWPRTMRTEECERSRTSWATLPIMDALQVAKASRAGDDEVVLDFLGTGDDLAGGISVNDQPSGRETGIRKVFDHVVHELLVAARVVNLPRLYLDCRCPGRDQVVTGRRRLLGHAEYVEGDVAKNAPAGQDGWYGGRTRRAIGSHHGARNPRSTRDQDRTDRMIDELRGDRAKDRTGRGSVAATAHDDEIGRALGGEPAEHLASVAGFRADLDDVPGPSQRIGHDVELTQQIGTCLSTVCGDEDELGPSGPSNGCDQSPCNL